MLNDPKMFKNDGYGIMINKTKYYIYCLASDITKFEQQCPELKMANMEMLRTAGPLMATWGCLKKFCTHMLKYSDLLKTEHVVLKKLKKKLKGAKEAK